MNGGPVSNDLLSLVPGTEIESKTLAFEFPGLRVGVAEYAEGPTGCTVFAFEANSQVSVDVRGGSHGTLLTEERDRVGAIVLAGGSLLGMESAAGVTAELFAQRNYASGWAEIPLVSAGIIYDYGLRANSIYPDKALGRAALRAAVPGHFPLGRHGAGCSATVGKTLGFDLLETAGQGAAFRQIGPTRVAVFTVVNAVGAIIDRDGNVVRGHRDPDTGRRYRYAAGLERKHARTAAETPPGNTTLTVVVTNQRFNAVRGTAWALRQFARMVHGSMARCIEPFHAPADGDVLWAVTTNEVDNSAINDMALGSIASELAWDAVLTCFSD